MRENGKEREIEVDRKGEKKRAREIDSWRERERMTEREV